jgi:hypothetical protein
MPILIRSTALAAMLALAACSQGPSNAPGQGGAKPGASAPARTGSVCDLKLLGVADVDGILDKPITGTKPLMGDAQTCYFTTGGEGMTKVRVSIRPGMGNASVDAFTSGRMNDYAKWQTLAGVGDNAVWKPELNEVSATRNNVLCEAAPEAGSLFLDPKLRASGKVHERLGALCNKVFAGYFNQPASNAPIVLGAE